MWFKKNKDENGPMSVQEALLEYKKRRNNALYAAVYGAALLAFGIIVENNPAITDETLRFMASVIGSVRLLLTLYIGIDLLSFFVNMKRYNDLAEELGVNKKKAERQDREEESENED